MRVIVPVADMRAAAQEALKAGRQSVFVPTMGYLHAGHLALVDEARRRGAPVVMSIFVNPLQFGPTEDFARYPRDLARDTALAERAGVDTLWTPETADLYPQPPSVTVDPGYVGGILEGAVRPGHFAGVLTVVAKLFAVVQPAVAVFGRKDAQQAFLVRRMVADLNLPVGIVVAPTVRDHDGLALSSRNVYLGADERARALALPRALAAGCAAFRQGERAAGRIVAAAMKELGGRPDLVVEYVNVVDPDTFQPGHAATAGSCLVAAIRVGGPQGRRLIDNVVLGEGIERDPVMEKSASRPVG